ncbi:MAG: hypothetical protein SFT94_06305, partial [Pseudanabaenaceae cyanobacterium bins.68]|nr:hypothetical protein [Pseudanabaenaceae cyanobacterium bins.68]
MVLEQSPEFPDFDLAELPDLPELEGEISATASQDSELDQLLGLSSGFEQEFGSGSSQFSSDLSGDGSLDDLMNELNSDPAFSNTGGFESLGLPESKTDVKIEQDEFASLLDDIAAESEQPDLSQSQTLELDPFSVDFAPSQAPIPDLEEAADDLMEDFATADTIQILETIAGSSTEAFPIEPGDQVNDLDDLESFLSAELPSTELGDVPDEPDPFGQITPEFSDPFAIQQSSVPSSSAFNYMDLEPEVSGEMGEFEVSVTPSQPGEDLPESVAELSPDLSLDSGAGFAADLEEVSTTPDVPIPVDFAEPNEP